MYDAGFRHVLASIPSRQRPGDRPLITVIARHIRWARLRRGNNLVLSLLEPFSECVPLTLMTLISGFFAEYFSIGITLCMIFGISWFLLDMIAVTITKVGHLSI